jgi:type VI secretion system secreted protein VgrG
MPQPPTTSIKLTTPLGPKKLLLRSMIMIDRLSEPYQIDLTCLSTDYNIDFDKLLGQPVGIEMELRTDKFRYFHGLVATMGFAGSSGKHAVYTLRLRPWLWFLTRAGDCRIFQEKNVVDIAGQVFADRGFTDVSKALSATYAAREYCVQYRESDFNFVCRLFEEEGIYYYFKHEKTKHTLILCDGVSAHQKVPDYNEVVYMPQTDVASYERESIGEWYQLNGVRTGIYSLTDYDFEKPKTDLLVRSSKPANHQQSKLEVFDWHPGEYKETGPGQVYADVRREELQADYERFNGKGNPRALGVGHLFKLKDYPREAYNKDYLVVGTKHELHSVEYEMGAIEDQPAYRFWTEFEAMDSKKPYRPPRVTPKAVVRGPQTAVVVGPTKGDTEIYTDKYGRVKLKFHWDHLNTKADEKSSCWIRVSNAWAGKKWGQIFLPRIGQEVIVDFLEGDPDRPIVTGRVYNADQMPPYELPADMTKSTIKTRSSTKGAEANFNELRFEDKKGKEEIYFHAERDFNRVVENNDTLKVGFEVKEQGNQNIDIYNNQYLKVGTGGAKDGSQHVTIHKDRLTTIKTGNDTLYVNIGDRKIHVKAGKQETEAATKILLKCGASTIEMTPAAITLKSVKIEVIGQATVDVDSTMTTVSGKAITVVKGGLVKIN